MLRGEKPFFNPKLQTNSEQVTKQQRRQTSKSYLADIPGNFLEKEHSHWIGCVPMEDCTLCVLLEMNERMLTSCRCLCLLLAAALLESWCQRSQVTSKHSLLRLSTYFKALSWTILEFLFLSCITRSCAEFLLLCKNSICKKIWPNEIYYYKKNRWMCFFLKKGWQLKR